MVTPSSRSGSPPPTPRKPLSPKPPDKVTEISQNVLGGAPPPPTGFFHQLGTRFKKWVAAEAVDFVFENEIQKDRNLIEALFGEDVQLVPELKRLAPSLYAFIKHFKPGIGETLNEATWEKILEAYSKRILIHLSLRSLDPEKKAKILKGEEEPPELDLEHVIQDVMDELIPLVGAELDEGDRKVAQGFPVDSNLFFSLAAQLYDTCLPPNDSLRVHMEGIVPRMFGITKDTIVSKLSEGISYGYKYVREKLEKKEPQAGAALPQTVVDPLIESGKKLGKYLLLIKSRQALQEDMRYLKALTKEESLPLLINRFSPSLQSFFKKMIPEEASNLLFGDLQEGEEILKGSLVTVLANISRNIFKNQAHIPVDHFVASITDHVAWILEKGFENVKTAHREGEPIATGAFDPLAMQLISLLMPEGYFLKNMIERRLDVVGAPLTELLLNFYQTQENSDEISECKERLVAAGIDEEGVEQVGFLCRNIAASCKGAVGNLFKDETALFLQLQAVGSPSADVKPLKGLVKGIHRIFSENNRSLMWGGESLAHFMETILLKGIVVWVEKIPQAQREPIHLLPVKLCKHLLDALSPSLSGLEEALQAVEVEACEKAEAIFTDPESEDYIEDEEERLEAIQDYIKEASYEKTREKMMDAVEALLECFFYDPVTQSSFQDLLPLPQKMREKTAGILKIQMASTLSKWFMTMTSWMHQNHQSKEKLETLYDSKAPIKFCHILSKMTAPGIAFACRENTTSLAKTLAGHVTPLLNEDGPAQGTDNTSLESAIKGLLSFVGERPGEENPKNALLDFMGEVVESILLKLWADVSERIKKQEDSQDPQERSILEALILNMLNHAKNHAHAIVHAKKRLKSNKAAKISKEDLVAEFDRISIDKVKILHPALKNQEGRTQFAQNWAGMMMDLLGITKGANLPFPNLVKHRLLEGLQKAALPPLVLKLFDMIGDPKTLNAALVDIFQSMENAPEETELVIKTRYKDEYQAQLEETLGTFLKGIVDMQPSFFPRLFMRIKKLEQTAGRTLGEPLRNMLRVEELDPKVYATTEINKPVSLLDVFKNLMQLSVDKIQPCVWVEESQTFQYEHLNKNGDLIEVTDKPRFKRLFPETQKEKNDLQKETAAEIKRLQKQAPKIMGKVISKETDRLFTQTYDKLWGQIVTGLDLVLSKLLGAYAAKARTIILPLVEIFVGSPLKIFFTILRYVIWLPIRTLLNFYINSETKARTKDIELKIHDNLIYHLADVAIQVMKNEALPRDPSSPIKLRTV